MSHAPGTLGWPLDPVRLSWRTFPQLLTGAGVRRIKLHGLRHTCATILVSKGEAVNVVAGRLVHTDAAMTLRVYAHVLQSQDIQSSS